MKKRNKTVINLLTSSALFGWGLYRVLTQELQSTPLIVAYILMLSGLIGFVVGVIELGKTRNSRKTF